MKYLFLLWCFAFLTAEHATEQKRAETPRFELNASRFWGEEIPNISYLLKNIDRSKIFIFYSYEEKILTPPPQMIEEARKKKLLSEKTEELIKNNNYFFKAIVPHTTKKASRARFFIVI